jgi:hypothetical protein
MTVRNFVPKTQSDYTAVRHVQVAEMRARTGLHADQAGRHVGKPNFYLATRPLLPQHDCATPIEADDVERVLADIDTDHGGHTVKLLSHGVPAATD